MILVFLLGILVGMVIDLFIFSIIHLFIKDYIDRIK